MIIKNRSGQTLLEMVFLLGLALVIVTGLTVTTINGLKNSRYSQNQVQATSLAQDAINQVRSFRDQDCKVAVGPSGSETKYGWYDSEPPPIEGIFTQFTGSLTFKIDGCGLKEAPKDDLPASVKNDFTRVITLERLERAGTNQIRVRVRVTWSDITGDHNSELVTILSNHD